MGGSLSLYLIKPGLNSPAPAGGVQRSVMGLKSTRVRGRQALDAGAIVA